MDEILEKIDERLVGQEDGVGVYKRKAISEIIDRLNGLIADHRTFLYVRANNILESNKLGGGNMTSALTAFSILSLLSKIDYYIDKPYRFTRKPNGEYEVVEVNAFCHFVKSISDKNISLGVDREDSNSKQLIWSGFRNYLAHLGEVEQGKQVVTFSFTDVDNAQYPTLSDKVLHMASDDKFIVFQGDVDNRNWQVYIDVLFAKVEHQILPLIVDKIIETTMTEKSAQNLYDLVTGKRNI